MENAFQFTQGSASQSFPSSESYDGQNYCFTVLGKIMLFKVNLTFFVSFFSRVDTTCPFLRIVKHILRVVSC